MSIAASLQFFELYRAAKNTDDYGALDYTFVKISDINVAVFKNQPTHDNRNPAFETTQYVGITDFVGVEIGDKLTALTGTEYLVVNIGDRGTQYQALFLNKI